MRTVLLLVFYAVVILALTPFILLCMLTGWRQVLVEIGLWAMRVSRVILGITVEASGLERVEPGRPYVFMPNHESFLDGPLVMALIPGAARVILKKSILKIPILGTAMLFVGFVPVDRKGAAGGKKSIARAVRLMARHGYSFLIFPEGTRSLDGRIGSFRRGGFFLALDSGAPIVPVTILGTRALMTKGQWYARRGRVRVIFHEPIAVVRYSVEALPALMAEVRAAIEAGKNPETAS